MPVPFPLQRAVVVLQRAGLASGLKDDQFVRAMILPEHIGHAQLSEHPASPSQTIYYVQHSSSGKAHTTETPSLYLCPLGYGL